MPNLNSYSTPEDVIRPIAAALEAAQYLILDEYGRDLAHDLIAWAQEAATRVAGIEQHAKAENQQLATPPISAADEWETLLRGTPTKAAQQEDDSADQYAEILKEVTHANQTRGTNHA
ncbi:hypothetical protein NG357_001993 [Escherichia coli]|nr:hypothetical protein [Escherichia coli]